MSIQLWVCLIVLALVWWYVLTVAPVLVQRMNGREPHRPDGLRASAELYDLLCFGLGAAIAVPPIYFWPNANPAMMCLFLFLGSTVGGLSAQWFVGRRSE